jgi:hypothetical protein
MTRYRGNARNEAPETREHDRRCPRAETGQDSRYDEYVAVRHTGSPSLKLRLVSGVSSSSAAPDTWPAQKPGESLQI